MAVAFLFPGQGSQYVGMLHSLPIHPAVKRTLAEVSDFLNRDVCDLDSEEALQSTVSVQLSIFTAGAAVGNALLELGLKPEAVSGLSVGTFAAAVVGRSLKLIDGVKLVKQRAELMAELFPDGYGMSAIVGLDQRAVHEIVASKCTESTPVFVSNINTSRQIVISGSYIGMDNVLAVAHARGARRAERLNVSVPSHCKLLRPVAEALRESLSGMNVSQPAAIYVSNVKARALRDADDVKADLADNIASTVHWSQGNVLLKELGCNLFLEINPGRKLTDLASENVPDIRAQAVQFASLTYWLKLGLEFQ